MLVVDREQNESSIGMKKSNKAHEHWNESMGMSGKKKKEKIHILHSFCILLIPPKAAVSLQLWLSWHLFLFVHHKLLIWCMGH